jgi:hypothetical protein
LPVLRVLQSVKAAAPQLKLHLFKSATNQHLFDCRMLDDSRTLDEQVQVLAKNWSSADEVGWGDIRAASSLQDSMVWLASAMYGHHLVHCAQT